MSPSSITTKGPATVADLEKVDGKAELIGGRIVHLMATGKRPHRIALNVFLSLENHAITDGGGLAFGDNLGFVVPELTSGRESFSPDAAFYAGPLPDDEMDFIPGPPTFAVEVRSKSNYGDPAERAILAKLRDYFEAGTLVVWDVDPVDDLIHSHRHDAPDHPETFRPGDLAHAEPAVPGWRVEVDELLGRN